MSWNQIGSYIGGEAAGDNFGSSVALSGDGTIVAIGAPYNDGGGTSAGSVRVYQNINNVWTQIGADINGVGGDTSGYSLSLSKDGAVLIIGAPLYNGAGGTDAGNARIYKNVSGTWTRINLDTGFDGGQAGSQMGFSVAISGNGLVAARGGIKSNNGSTADVGSVRAYSYVSGTTWNLIGDIIYGEGATDLSGWSLALNNDGSVMAIGAAFNNGNGTDSGSVRVYKNVNSVWTKISNDVTFDGSAAGDHAGSSLSLNGDGTVLAIGSDSANPSGQVRVFSYSSGTTWTKIGSNLNGINSGDQAGGTVALSSDGTILAVGAQNSDNNGIDSGTVYLYKNINNVWTQIGPNINGQAAGDKLRFVALSNDGTIIAVGAPFNDGTGTDAGNVKVLKYIPTPNAPSISSVTISELTATINFTQSPSDSTITSYKYAVSTNGGAYGSFITSNWTSGTSFTVSGLTIGSNYTFKLIANNNVDSAESSVSNTVTVSNFAPNAPTSVTASVSGTTATISFTAGTSNNSSAVSSYKYAVSTNGGAYGSFTSSNWTSGTSFTVPNLTVGSNYTFKLKANNGIDSAESSVSNTVTVSNFAPNAPTSVTASVSGITATISFTAGTSNNSSAVSSYKYAVSTNGGAYGSFTSSNWTSGTSFTVPNLTVGSNYTFKLKANNGIDSAESSVSNTVTVSNFAPNAPTTLSASVSGTTATINFTQDSNSSLAVSSYTYAASTNGSTYGPFLSTNLTKTSATQVTISGLTTSTNYTFKLKANNGIDSAESLASNTVTVAAPSPNPPTITSINVSGSTATINFTPGASNGSSAVTGYKYAYSTTTSTGTYTPALFTSTDLSWINGTTSLTVSNLQAGTLYLKLKATNGNDSDASNASTAITIANFPPNAPTITSVSASNGIATINFTQTDNNSLTVSSYKYAYSTTTSTGTYIPALFTTNNLSWTSGTTSLTVSNLPVGTLYLKLIANNGFDSSESTPSNAVTVANYAPSAPTTLSASVSGTTATITFTPTTNNSNTVSSYFYAMSTNGGAYGSPFTLSNWTVGTSFFTVTGLVVGSNYSFKLKAYNGIDSAESTPSNTVTVVNFAPDAPKNVIAEVSSGVVTIRFTQDSNGSNAVTSYKYAVSTNSGTYGSFTTVTVSGTSFTISGLTIGNNYNFILKANNGNDSIVSNASNQVTVTNFAPARPTITSVNVSGRTATINFTPGTPNGSLAVTSYQYSYSSNGGSYINFTPSGWTSGSQISVSNLDTGSYFFKLIASNSIDSAESVVSNQVDIIPFPPIIGTAALSGLSSAIINFTQPAISATDINSYQYAFKTSLNGTYSSYRNTNLSWTPGSYSVIISNLISGNTYYFKLKALKNTLSSIDSNESTSIFVNFAPATPQISSISAFNGTATINFSVSNNGSLAISKYVYSTDNPVTSNSIFYDFPLINGAEQKTSPLIISRLTNGTTYSFTIRGSNGINSQASNTINNVAMLANIPTPRITSGRLEFGKATINLETPTGTGLPEIKNYYYKNGTSMFASYIPLNPAQNTSPLIIPGLTSISHETLTIKAEGVTNILSKESNQITLIPIMAQPNLTIVTGGLKAVDGIAEIPFNQTLLSNNNSINDIAKYVYCTDTTITASSVFIDVPLRDGLVQRTSPFIIPYTISNPGSTSSLSFTFKSYTNSQVYSAASPKATVTLSYSQPPPIITSVQSDGFGNATITINQATTYSYTAAITNYAFSTDGKTYKLFSPAQKTGTFKIYGITQRMCDFTFKSFNGSYGGASNIVEDVLVNYNPPPPPVITFVSGSQDDATIRFTQDTNGLDKNITGFSYRLNSRGNFINLTIAPSAREFTINNVISVGSTNTIEMKSTNGKFSEASISVSFTQNTVDRATYVDPSDGIRTILIKGEIFNANDYEVAFSTDGGATWKKLRDLNLGELDRKMEWPFFIGNNSPDTPLKLKLASNFFLNPVNSMPNKQWTRSIYTITPDFFVIKSPNIIIDGDNKYFHANSAFMKARFTKDIRPQPDFLGCIRNGSADDYGYDNVIVKNVGFRTNFATHLMPGRGWVCADYFGRGTTGNKIQNVHCFCESNIPELSGGITGQFTAVSSTNFTITDCSCNSNISDGADGANSGGIVGPYSGTRATSFTISNCIYTGSISGNGSGGIIGAMSTNVSIRFCSSTGIIKGGGIAGDYTGVITNENQVLVTISDCFSKGGIGSDIGTTGATSAGGIIGAHGGAVTINRCYSIGEIGGIGKNDCGGIVGGYAGESLKLVSIVWSSNNSYNSASGAVVVNSCFSTGNINAYCGGIAGMYFGNKVSRSCGIYDSYSLGNIGETAGGIAAPQFAAGAVSTCYINNCYSLGLLQNSSSGGIIGPSTVTYIRNKRTINIMNSFNSFSLNKEINSIVGLGFGSTANKVVQSTIPLTQTDNGISYTTIEQVNYAEAFIKYPARWKKIQSSTSQSFLLQVVNGTYIITSDIIASAPNLITSFSVLSVSDLLMNAELTITDLLTIQINLTSTINEFNIAGITLGDLFIAQYTLDIIQQIGYTISNVLSIRPNTKFKELIDANFMFKTSTKPGSQIAYNIDDLINPLVNPVLTVFDIIKTGFTVADIKKRTEPLFSLATMIDLEVDTKFLLGPGGFLASELKSHGCDVERFRICNYSVERILNLGFKPKDFQGSKFPISSYKPSLNSGLFTTDDLEFIGFSQKDIMTEGLYSWQLNNFSLDKLMESYIYNNVPVHLIPKTTIIQNIETYWKTVQPKFVSDKASGKNFYNPNDFLRNDWSKTQVSQMGFSARTLLDSNKFNLSDLLTAKYSQSAILASEHRLATSANLAKSGFYSLQSPPLITAVITSDYDMYVYFDFIINNTSPDIVAVGYSLNQDCSGLKFVPAKSPLRIKNIDYSVDNYLYLATFNGLLSPFNSISIGDYKKPVPLKVKKSGVQVLLGIALIIVGVAVRTAVGALATAAATTGVGGAILGRSLRRMGNKVGGMVMHQGLETLRAQEVDLGYVGVALEAYNTLLDDVGTLTDQAIDAASSALGVGKEALGAISALEDRALGAATGFIKDKTGQEIPAAYLTIPGQSSSGGIGFDIGFDPSEIGIPLTREGQYDLAGNLVADGAEKCGAVTKQTWVQGRWTFHPYQWDKVEMIKVTTLADTLAKLTELWIAGKSSFNNLLNLKRYGPKNAITRNSISLFSSLVIGRAIGDSDRITVYPPGTYWGGQFRRGEVPTEFYYSLDDGETWTICPPQWPEKQSHFQVGAWNPIVIKGNFNLYENYTVRIRYFSKRFVNNFHSPVNTFAMNEFYSQQTNSGQCSFPISLGIFSEPSNPSSVIMRISPFTPEVYYIYYNSKLGSVRVYFVQNINSSGDIKDYEWTKDKAKTWTSTGISFVKLSREMTSGQLGASVAVGSFNTKLRYFDINVGTKSKSYSISIRACGKTLMLMNEKSGVNEPVSEKSGSSTAISTSTDDINVWINKPENKSVYDKIRM